MPRDLGQLLHDTAVRPDAPVDVPAIVRHGRRRRLLRHGAAGAAGVASIIAVIAVAASLVGPPVPPPIIEQPPTSPAPLPTGAENDPTPIEMPTFLLEPVACPPNASCLPAFVLGGIEYVVGPEACSTVRSEAVGPPIQVSAAWDAAEPSVPTVVHRLADHPVAAGVAVEAWEQDWACDGMVLARPSTRPSDATSAVAAARLRCDVLAEPTPRQRCDDGGDASWRTGDGWYELSFAPFPDAVEAADAAIAAEDPDRMWRTDPVAVATRHYEAEGVCRDADGQPCVLDVDIPPPADGMMYTDLLGLTIITVVGTVHPFPHVTWDIAMVVERLGLHGWWVTAMTIEPRA